MSYLRCSARLYLQLFVGGLMFYLRCSSSLPPVVCRGAHVLFTMFCSSLPPVICRGAVLRCSARLYLQCLIYDVLLVFTSSCL